MIYFTTEEAMRHKGVHLVIRGDNFDDAVTKIEQALRAFYGDREFDYTWSADARTVDASGMDDNNNVIVTGWEARVSARLATPSTEVAS